MVKRSGWMHITGLTDKESVILDTVFLKGNSVC